MKRKAVFRWLGRWGGRALLVVIGLSVALVLPFRWIDPPFSAVMLQRELAEGAPMRQEWAPLEAIDPAVALAVVAAEDQRFPEHWGLDVKEIRAAVETRIDGGRLRGASTLSQQVARNLFLWQGRSYLRKGLEVWITLLVEGLWTKRRILEMYLNFAQTGERMFGVAAASRRYFKRPPDRLGRRRAALLAAVLPNPMRFRIDRPSEFVLKRRDWILEQMRNLGGERYLASMIGARMDR